MNDPYEHNPHTDHSIRVERHYAPRQYARHRAMSLLSTPHETFAETVKFNLRPDVMRARYDLAMLKLEIHAPMAYKTLMIMRLPKPY